MVQEIIRKAQHKELCSEVLYSETRGDDMLPGNGSHKADEDHKIIEPAQVCCVNGSWAKFASGFERNSRVK